MTVLVIPNTFANRTTSILLSDMDENFSYLQTQLTPYTNAIAISGTNVSVPSGTLTVSGNATVGGTLNVTGNTNVTGTIGITGVATLSSLGVTGNATVGGTLGVTGTTTLGTTDIATAQLSFGSATRQMVNLWSTNYGIGIQNSTQYYRTGGSFAWFLNGVHSNTQFDAGLGGSVLMSLNNAGVLNVPSSVYTNTVRASTGVDTTVPTGYRVKGTDVGSLYAPGMIIQTIYKRVDSKDAVAFATAGQVGSFITSLDTIITPKFANSLILIQMCLTYEVHHDTVFRLYRGATAIGINANDANYWSGTWLPGYDADNDSTARTNHFFYMDSPATTTAITYRLMIQSGGVGASTFYLNRTISSAGQGSYEVGISQVILQEIAQ